MTTYYLPPEHGRSESISAQEAAGTVVNHNSTMFPLKPKIRA